METTPNSSRAERRRAALAAPNPIARGISVAGLVSWALFVIVLLAFIGAVRHEFIIYDDSSYVYSNPNVTSGISRENLRWAFAGSHHSNWHPLTWISHMADCQIFGLKPWGHHFTNVLLHALNTVLLFALLRQLTGAFWRSALVAAVFGLHPLRVESVAWVAERKDVLCAFFFLLTLLAYARYAAAGGGRAGPPDARPRAGIFYALALASFALGLLSKPMVVTLPFVLLLLDYWPLQRLNIGAAGDAKAATVPLPKLLVEKAPFFLLTVISCVVTFNAQKAGGAIRTIPPALRMENALVAACRYVGKVLYPVNLSVFYPFDHSLPVVQAFLAFVVLLVASALVLLAARRCRYLTVGWFWFLGMLVPVIGLVPVGGQSMADRYTYLPSIGLAIMLVWGGFDLAARAQVPRFAAAAAAFAAMVLLFCMTEHQLAFWRDSESLFRHALAVTGENGAAHGILGVALLEKHKDAEAEKELREGLRLEPRDALFHYRLATILFTQQDHLYEAMSEFQTCLDLKPGFPNADYKLALAFSRVDRIDEALPHFEEAARLQPADAQAQYMLGGALAETGKTNAAVEHWNQALKLKPDLAGAHNDLSRVLEKEGHLDEAIAQSKMAVQYAPDSPDYHNNLGTTLAKAGRYDEAEAEFRKTLDLRPTELRAAINLSALMQYRSDAAADKAGPGQAGEPVTTDH